MLEEKKRELNYLMEALSKAQGKFRTPNLNRTAEVKKEGKLLYKTDYADLQECIDCIRGPLSENGLSFIQSTELMGNNWVLVLELMHSSGESKKTYLPLNVNQTNQQLGGTLTYLKRYQLSAFFGLAADFDDDGNATTDNEVRFEKRQESKPLNHAPGTAQGSQLSEAQVNRFWTLVKIMNLSKAQVEAALKEIGKNSLLSLTKEEYTIITAKWQAEIDKRNKTNPTSN